MSTGDAIWLAVQAVVFVLWGLAVFRVLLRLRRDAVEATGTMFPGPCAALATVADFLRRPEYAGARWRIGGLTLALFALVLLRPT